MATDFDQMQGFSGRHLAPRDNACSPVIVGETARTNRAAMDQQALIESRRAGADAGGSKVKDPATSRISAKIDRIDLNILAALHRNGRVSKTDMSEMVGVSATRCCERIKRLERSGVIKGYHARIDLPKILPAVYFMVQVKISNYTPVRAQQFEQTMLRMKEIVGSQSVLGSIDYILTVVASDIDHYQEIITRLQEVSMVDFDFTSFPITRTLKSVENIPLPEILAELDR